MTLPQLQRINFGAAATGLTAGKPRVDLLDLSPSPVSLVFAERDQPGHPGIGHGQGEMVIPGHAPDVQRLDLDHIGLGCQPMDNLVQQILPAIPHHAVDHVNGRAWARRRADPFLRRDFVRSARRNPLSALRRCLGAATSSNPAPSNVVTSVATPRSTPTVTPVGSSGAGRAHSNCADNIQREP
jgi:hypothetical protein